MRLSDLPRTTSFRLAVLFLTLFGIASLSLFGFLYWQTTRYITTTVDGWLEREIAQFATFDDATLETRLARHSLRDPENQRPFGLFTREGAWIAGNLERYPRDIAAFDRPFEFNGPGSHAPMRALAHRLPSGSVLVISQNIHDLREFYELFTESMASAGVLILVLGLAGSAVLGAGSVRRIDDVTRAIQRIVAGDLSERLPTRGNSDDVDRLVTVVNGMLDDLERLMHEVKGVGDAVAHDLRTPLTRLLAGLERVRRREGSIEDYRRSVDDAVVETQGVLKTFAALLRISELEAGVRRSGFEPVNLAQIASDVVDLYEPVAEEKGVKLALVPAATPAPASIPGDPSLLFEAIANLVDNSIKFTPAGGHIEVLPLNRSDGSGIGVADTGPGIEENERAAVMKRFHRGEKSRHLPGNGLGLSLVAAVARLHGMQVSIENRRPGCVFTLWRPRSELTPLPG